MKISKSKVAPSMHRERSTPTKNAKLPDTPLSKPCFNPSALKFLQGLERNNRREWFEPRKAEFERELKLPMLAIIERVTTAMADFAPEHMRPATKCMMRIYRDTRFSADKSPYKRNIAAWWSREGLEKTSGGGFYFHVTAKEVVIAAGVYMPERDQLLAIRTYLLDHHQDLRKILNGRALRRLLPTFEGQTLSRPPKGFPKDSPAMDLLLCRQWGMSATLPAEGAIADTFVAEIIKRFRAAAPLVNALNAPLLARQNVGPKGLFPMIEARAKWR